MMNADELFIDALEAVLKNYKAQRFFLERDFVYVLQLKILDIIIDKGLKFRVFHEHTIGEKSVDLAITNDKDFDNPILVAEFKYQPDTERKDKDIVKKKYNQVGIGDVIKDFDAILQLKKKSGVKHLYAILIDEGGYFQNEYSNKKCDNYQRLIKDSEMSYFNDKLVVYIFNP